MFSEPTSGFIDPLILKLATAEHNLSLFIGSEAENDSLNYLFTFLFTGVYNITVIGLTLNDIGSFKKHQPRPCRLLMKRHCSLISYLLLHLVFQMDLVILGKHDIKLILQCNIGKRSAARMLTP